MNDIVYFISKNWVNLSLVIVGSFAMIIYKLQERKKIIEAASLVIIQIDELMERLIEIPTYIVNGLLNDTAFYESLILMEQNYWNEYKHLFVRKMDKESYNAINKFYDYVSEIQEQQELVKQMQKNYFIIVQNALINIESHFVICELMSTYNDNMAQFNFSCSYQTSEQYRQAKKHLEAMFNQQCFSRYTPEQIRMSLEKVLKQCSMVTIIGTSGYNLLKKISKRKF